MIDIESIKYSLRNLNNRKGRSFLTIFSILVGIATIFIFISFGGGLYKYMEDLTTGSSADKLLIMAKSGGAIPGMDDTFKLTKDDVEVVQKTAGVFEATGIYFKGVEFERGKESFYSFLVSYDPKIPLALEMFNIEEEKGRTLQQGDDKKVLVGYNFLVPGKIFDCRLK